MTAFADVTRARAPRRRVAALGAALACTLPAVLGAAALPASATSSIGGPRMAESGLIFGGGAKPPPETSGGSYVIADADTGEILAAKNPHGHYRPASTLKTLLALTMAPRVDANATYTADAADTEVEGTRVGLVEHQTYPIDLIWDGMFLRSGNDAANAIAKAGADGDVAKAVRMMNAEAHRLQAWDTTAVNPSGLDADGQYSSAYDLSLFGRAALERGDLRRHMKKLKIVFPGDHTRTSTKKNSKSFDVFTGNRLILHGYKGAIGVKNGYTTLAHNTFIAAAERDGHTIIATLMAESGGITPDSMALLDWGFANIGKVVPVGTLVEPASLALASAEDGVAPPPAVTAAPEAGLAAGVNPMDAVRAVGAATHSGPGGLSAPVVGALAVAAAVAGVGAGALVLRRRRAR